jgi:hypothetical protein
MMSAIEMMSAYRVRLASAGRMLEARAVERCIRLAKAAQQDKPKDDKQ